MKKECPVIVSSITKLADFIKSHWFALTVINMVVISALSLWPQQHLPSAPGSDKLHHFIAYAALMFPGALRKPSYLVWVALGLIAFSGAIELIQPYVNRYGEWADLAANTFGVLCGYVIAQTVNYFLSSISKNSP